MAKVFEYTTEELEEWTRWLESRPPEIRAAAESYPPNILYRLKSSNHRATIYSYSEDGTVTVDVTGDYNKVVFSRRVFGILPEDLEECELPSPDEELGDMAAQAGYTEQQIKDILIPRMMKG